MQDNDKCVRENNYYDIVNILNVLVFHVLLAITCIQKNVSVSLRSGSAAEYNQS